MVGVGKGVRGALGIGAPCIKPRTAPGVVKVRA